MNQNFAFSRRGPDTITEELVAVLSGAQAYEFKALLKKSMRHSVAAKWVGGEEMMRLRTYDKLQNLVLHGQVKKTGKQYKGVHKQILLLGESLKTYRENGPPHRQSSAAQA